MSALRYRWGDEPPQVDPWVFGPGPIRPRPTTLTLLVGRHEVWQGEVADLVSTWGRWCALRVVHLWRCPAVVRLYLEAGDGAVFDEAQDALRAVIPTPHVDPGSSAAGAARESATWALGDRPIRAAGCAARAQAHEVARCTDPAAWNIGWASMVAEPEGGSAAAASLWTRSAGPRADGRAAAEAGQLAHLRSSILRRALPKGLWPLVDGDDGVLCDALLDRISG